MGLGLLGGGVGTARYFLEQGANVTITDLRDERTLHPSLAQLDNLPFRGVFGKHDEEDFRNADLVVRNPAVPETSSYLASARDAGVAIETEASIFITETHAFIVGVTGTKGKTTAAHFVNEIFHACGVPAFLTGIPGTSFLKTLAETQEIGDAVVVAELSSWDLQSIAPHKKSPPIGIITNIFPDHLNRHTTMADYLEAKTVIFKYQHGSDVLVIPESETMLVSQAKQAPGGVRIVEEREVTTMPVLAIPGRHVRRNAALALIAARTAMTHAAWPVFGTRFSEKNAQKAVARFRGLEGRLQQIAICNGRIFINDTAATNPGATIAALQTIAGPAILIAGGEDKALPYQELAKRITEKVKHVVMFPGSASEKLERNLQQYGFTALSLKKAGMQEAVRAAWAVSKPGDRILLSPAAASFNQFRNEFDRGKQFVQAVKNLCASEQ